MHRPSYDGISFFMRQMYLLATGIISLVAVCMWAALLMIHRELDPWWLMRTAAAAALFTAATGLRVDRWGESAVSYWLSMGSAFWLACILLTAFKSNRRV